MRVAVYCFNHLSSRVSDAGNVARFALCVLEVVVVERLAFG